MKPFATTRCSQSPVVNLHIYKNEYVQSGGWDSEVCVMFQAKGKRAAGWRSMVRMCRRVVERNVEASSPI